MAREPAMLREVGGYWEGRLFKSRVHVLEENGVWTARVYGRGLKDREKFTDTSFQGAAAQARRWIEKVVGARRD